MDKLLAAFTFFTRLPFWKIKTLPADSFGYIITYWPFIGWLTAGIMVSILWTGTHILPISFCWILALISRLLVTGALHEDGYADFWDAFGGRNSTERTLDIMKDSHIGTYGVLALIIYYILMYQMHTLPLNILMITVITGDCFCKFTASQLINILPYARKKEDSKAKIVYHKMNNTAFIINTTGGLLLPIIILPYYLLPALIIPPILLLLLVAWIKKRINGYTGDCCGAAFIICELSYYLSVFILYHICNSF